jgi:hypothetical protein
MNFVFRVTLIFLLDGGKRKIGICRGGKEEVRFGYGEETLVE